MNAWLRRWTIAAVVVFALMTPYLARFSVQKNRYFVHWRRADVLSFLLIIALGAALLVVGEWAVRKTRNSALLRMRSLIVGVLLGLPLSVSIYDHQYGGVIASQGAYFWLIPIVMASLCCWSRKISRFICAVCLIFSPIVLLVPARMLLYPVFQDGREDFPPPGIEHSTSVVDDQLSDGDVPSVYVLVFDEWSFERTFDQSGAVHSDMPNLAELAGISDVYLNAHSPAPHTDQSLPRIIFQTEMRFGRSYGVPGFWGEGSSWHPASEMQGLFANAKALGMNSAMVGWYHPYRRLLGERIDFVDSVCQYEWFGAGVTGRALYHLSGVVGRCLPPLPGVRQGWQRWEDSWDARAQIPRTDHIHELALRTVGTFQRPTTAVFHYPVPHRPFIFTREGPRETPMLDHSSVEGYRGNLAYMDSLLGEFVSALRENGKLEGSFLIVTSDHTWRDDPAYLETRSREQLTHVPLLVKAPRQAINHVMGERFELTGLAELMDAATDSD